MCVGLLIFIIMVIPLIAAGASLAGSAISSLINNASVNSANKANMAFQQQQQAQQNLYNKQQYDAQVLYNSPAATMQRFKSAGLNPNLIYGPATAAGTFAGPPPQSAKVEYVAQPHPAVDFGRAASEAVNVYNSTRTTEAQVSNTEAQTTNTQEDTILKQAIETLTRNEAAKTGAETDVVRPMADATIANLFASANKSVTEANVTSFLAPFQADVAAANTEKLKADTAFVISDNARQAALASTNIQEAIARMALDRVQTLEAQAKTAVDQATVGQIKAQTDNIVRNTILLLGSQSLQDMDISMRNAGMMPHDSGFQRVLSAIGSWIFGTNAAGGIDRNRDVLLGNPPAQPVFKNPISNFLTH